jgi:hypothetical protein
MCWIPKIDDDGGIAITKAGMESGKITVVLLGCDNTEHYERLKSRAIKNPSKKKRS